MHVFVFQMREVKLIKLTVVNADIYIPNVNVVTLPQLTKLQPVNAKTT